MSSSSARDLGLSHVEQDQEPAGDDLPTYEDLAARSGPNSRFGRWRSWIEKRAAERYADITPEERERRRTRGWDLEQPSTSVDPDVQPQLHQPTPQFPIPLIYNEPPTPLPGQLRVQTDFNAPPPDYSFPSPSPTPPPLVTHCVRPSHLLLSNFGSRFLPHTTATIRTLLPLPSERLLLIGHDDGLSVLDMFPQDWTDNGLTAKGPNEAEARPIWEGEAVFKMTLLEIEDTSSSTPQGTVLALVGHADSDVPSGTESTRSIRMYNLASLVSLAKWTVAQKGAKPLNLRKPVNWNPQQTPAKKHHPRHSLAKSLQFLSLQSPSQTHDRHSHHHHHRSSSPSSTRSLSEAPSSFRGPSPSSSREPLVEKPLPSVPPRRDSSASPSPSASIDTGWDIVEDLPLRWATHYVPLATPGSRLSNASVLTYDIWRDEGRRGRGGTLLAVATKANILLYETPKGERAFRYVKDFYTPLQPRSLTFVHQSFHDSVVRSPSDGAYARSSPSSSSGGVGVGAHRRASSATSRYIAYGNQICLFVIFDKKAVIIRVADSAVSEVELFAAEPGRESLGASPSNRRSRSSLDGGGTNAFGFTKESKGHWLPPATADVPYFSQGACFLTRGRQTHVLPSPLPPNIPSTPPLQVFQWNYQPNSVSARLLYCQEDEELPPTLQLVAVGDYGVEVQEISVSYLSSSKGKGRAVEPIRAHMDLGGDAGFLCKGGQWHRSQLASLGRAYSAATSTSSASFDSLETEEIALKVKREQGIYGWVRKGAEDWRIFWVGGTEDVPEEVEEEEEDYP